MDGEDLVTALAKKKEGKLQQQDRTTLPIQQLIYGMRLVEVMTLLSKSGADLSEARNPIPATRTKFVRINKPIVRTNISSYSSILLI